MSLGKYANPTALRLGVRGTLDGRQYTVKGRVVLGAEIDGETWYWNEFRVVDATGGELTLVHEETDDGFVWRSFRLYEPAQPMRAAEAAAKQAGDTIMFEGRPLHITLVDQTRVYHIEGEAPEGVEAGDIASFFNAESDGRTLVVSWTGEEVEFYEGQDLAAGHVERAFNLPTAGSASRLAASQEWSAESGLGWNPLGFVKYGVFGMLGIGGLLGGLRQCDRLELIDPPPKQAAPAWRVPAEARGMLAGTTYTVSAQALVEIARQGGKFDRYEYSLTGETGRPALLINGLTGQAGHWHLLQPQDPPAGFTAYDAAAMRQGRLAPIAGRMIQVKQLFLAKVVFRIGVKTDEPWPAPEQYGLVAEDKDGWLVLRWSQDSYQFFNGKPVAEKEVRAAFAPVETGAKP